MQSTSATISRPTECGIPTSFSGPENPKSQTNHIMKKPTRSALVSLAIATTGALFLVGCGNRSENPESRINASLNYRGIGVLDATCPASISGPKWQFQAEAWIRSSPALSGNKVVFGSADGNLYCLDTEQGTLAWKFEVGNRVNAEPTIHDGVVYLCTFEEYLIALDLETGEELWRFDALEPLNSKPLIYEGVAYFSSLNGEVYAVDLKSPEDDLWDFSTLGDSTASPSTDGERIYITNHEGYAYAINKSDGEEVWSTRVTRHPFMKGIAVGDQALYCGSLDGTIHALNPADGEPLWEFKSGSRLETAPAVAAGKVLFGSQDNHLHALDATTGAELWKHALKNRLSLAASPRIAGDKVIFGTRSGIHAHNIETGEEIWAFPTPKHVGTSPVIHNNAVFFGADNGVFYAIH